MATLFNTRISDTYSGLIKTIDNAALTASLKELTDGSGLSSGVYMNTAGDFKVTAILEFGSLKDTGENIIISKFVDEADGIANNDNDTSIPTTAAIVDYVAAQITAEDLDFTGDTGSGQIDLDSQIFAIGGTSNEITTVASGQSLTLSLDSTGVNLPNNSTAITQTAGDNSTKIATTSYVDTLDAASDLDFSGDSGTGDVNLNAQTFAITGTTNQIITAASGQGLSLSLPTTVHRDLQGNVTGNVTGDLTGNVTATSILVNGVTATTQASSDNSTKVATTEYVKGLNNASDLDFTTDSGSGAVVLNSETFSVLGTTNEIETSGSGQAVTIGLPSTVNVNVTGNLTGNVTGNVTGDLTGDVTGNVTGNLTGNSTGTHTGAVIGNVTGNVTGDLTGNADSATKWQTARDLSVSGEATGTISSVDGTSNVSGALTLDNNSVTGKVLTGLTSPSASSVLATDTIVEGFGKLQSQVNGLANGLRFIGSWDADLNSPLLSDGGGESASGTTTGVATNKLIDSNASFTSAVLNDKVVNQVDGQTATVSAVDNGTQLTLSADIMLSGEAYTIDNSPYITQGHYYVVDNGGATNLNGISSWSIGDWVIAGANNEWTKLDHSQVDGTGTPTYITKWSANQVIADSIMSESGSTITVAGALTTNTNLSSTGNFAVNTDKFTANATSGNVAFTGDLAINTDKFTVNATSGSATFAGDLTTTAGRLQLGAVALPSAGVAAITNRSSDNSLYIQTSSGNTAYLLDGSQNTMYSAGSTAHNFYISNVPKLTIDSNGDSTFAGDVTSSGNIGSTIDANTTNQLSVTNSNSGSSATARVLIISDSGNMQLKAVSSTNTTYGAGDVGVINCDTMSGGLRFAHNDQVKYTLAFDGENTWTGGGTFGGNVTTAQINLNSSGGGIIDNQTGNIFIQTPSGTGWIFRNGASGYDEKMRIDSDGNVGIGISNPNSYDSNADNLVIGSTGANDKNGITIVGGDTDGRGAIYFADTAQNSAGYITYLHSNNSMLLGTSDSTSMTIDSDGNVGINDTNPNTANLSIKGQSTGVSVNYPMLKLLGQNTSSDGLHITTTGSGNNYYAIKVATGGNSSAFNVTNAGNVGISTDSPDSKLQVVGAGQDQIRFGTSTSIYTDLWMGTGYSVIDSIGGSEGGFDFRDDGTSRMRLKTPGSTIQDVTLQLKTTGASDNAGIMFINSGNTSSFNDIAGIASFVESGSAKGNLQFWTRNSDGDNTDVATRMTIDSSGNVGVGSGTPLYLLGAQDIGQIAVNRVPSTGVITDTSRSAAYINLNASNGGSSLTFHTANANNTAPTERMRITSGGNINIGSGSLTQVAYQLRVDSDFDNGIYLSAGSGNDSALYIDNGAGTSELFIVRGDGNIKIPAIGVTTGATAVGVDSSGFIRKLSSSKRYKKDIESIDIGLDFIDSLSPVKFKMKEDDVESVGLIAEDMIDNRFVTYSQIDMKDESKGLQVEGVNYQALIAPLIKSIQELKAEVDKLKQECKCKN
jgi:hypothetical protein